MLNIPGNSSNTPPDSPVPHSHGSPSKGERPDAIKRTFSEELSRKGSDLSLEKSTKHIHQSAKRQKIPIDIHEAVQSKRFDKLLDYFREHPEKLFKYAELIKSLLNTGQMVFSEFLPILIVAAENLKVKKTPLFTSLSVKEEPPNSLLRLFKDEFTQFVDSEMYGGITLEFFNLVKQDAISIDPYLSSMEAPDDLIIKMFSGKTPNGNVFLQQPENMAVLLPLLLEKSYIKEAVDLLFMYDGPNERLFNGVTQEIVNSLSLEHQLRLCNIVISEPEVLGQLIGMDPIAEDYKALSASIRNSIGINNKVKGNHPLVLEGLDQILSKYSEAGELKILLLASFIESYEIPLSLVKDKISDKELFLLSDHLRYVDLLGFDNISLAQKIIKNTRHLDILKIDSGKWIEGFDQLHCRQLICKGCQDLLKLPDLPFCSHLSLSNCNSITSLPDRLVRCMVLKLIGCGSLKEISCDLPQCLSVAVVDCENMLQITSTLHKCYVFQIKQCKNIARLPDALPNCYYIIINNCPILDQLPKAMPKCVRFELADCPKITHVDQLPELPISVDYVGELADDFYDKISIFPVNFEKIKTEPKKLLLEFAHYLSMFMEMPRVLYYIGGNPIEAEDAGGVSRDFITRLCENLFKIELQPSDYENFLRCDVKRDPYPNMTLDDEIDAYFAIGTLFAACNMEESELRTGPLFSHKVYECLTAAGNVGSDLLPPSDEWLFNSYLLRLDNDRINALVDPEQEVPDLTPEDCSTIAYLLDDENPPEITPKYFSNKENRKYLRTALQEKAKTDPVLPAIAKIAQGMKIYLIEDTEDVEWQNLQNEGASALKDKIEGVLSKEILIDRIKWKDNPNIDRDSFVKTQNYLYHWIDQNDTPERLGLFVRAATGSKTLGVKKLTIEVFNRGKEYIPQSHTCFDFLELSAEYGDQEQFNLKLEILLRDVMIESGFSSY